MNNEKNVPIDDTSMYANVFSFMGLPFSRDVDDDGLDAFVMGVPYDQSVTNRPQRSYSPASSKCEAKDRVRVRFPEDGFKTKKVLLCHCVSRVYDGAQEVAGRCSHRGCARDSQPGAGATCH